MSGTTHWLRGSTGYRLASGAWRIYRQSIVYRILAGILAVIRNSRVSYALSEFFKKGFTPEDTLIYRLLLKAGDFFGPFREKSSEVIRKSVTSSLFKNSVTCRVLPRLLIPLASFFVLFDEFGRSVFGSGRLVGYWDEIYLFLCIVFLFAARPPGARNAIRAATPLDAPIFLLISVSFSLFLARSVYPAIAFEGMRVVVEFILWFFVFSFFLDEDDKAYAMIKGLVLTGGILGLYGTAQAIVGVNTPPGWTDFAEGVKSSRVYSFVGSPNILGSIMTLIVPIGLACAMNRRFKGYQRVIAASLTAVMFICLILTLSRGAWLGMATGLVIFCLAYNPRWLVGLCAAGGLTLLVPAVSNRIRYLLSPQYIANSLIGGRLMRYQAGWQMFMDNLWLGVGLGNFGGAVAMNHKDVFPNTFYMDSYWLKTAVEMGLAGLTAFFILVLVLLVWSVRAINNTKDRDKRIICIGGLSGMSGIIIHNFFENVFEVPYMVIYFWLVAAIVMYFGFRNPKPER